MHPGILAIDTTFLAVSSEQCVQMYGETTTATPIIRADSTLSVYPHISAKNP
jgi:hypothetical protein